MHHRDEAHTAPAAGDEYIVRMWFPFFRMNYHGRYTEMMIASRHCTVYSSCCVERTGNCHMKPRTKACALYPRLIVVRMWMDNDPSEVVGRAEHDHDHDPSGARSLVDDSCEHLPQCDIFAGHMIAKSLSLQSPSGITDIVRCKFSCAATFGSSMFRNETLFAKYETLRPGQPPEPRCDWLTGLFTNG